MVAFTFQGFVTGDTVTLSVDQGALNASGTVPSWDQVSFSVDEIAGEAVVTYGSGGALSITISGGIYAGTYTQDVNGTPLTAAAVETSALCLVLSTISGTTNVGDTLTITPGLWIYTGDNPGDPILQHQRDGVDIPNGNGLSHVITGDDQGTSFSVVQTLAGQSATSAGMVIADPTLASDANGILWYSPDEVTVNGLDRITSWANHVTGANADFDLDSVPSDVSAPIWNAAGYAELNGANALRSSVGISNILYSETQVHGRSLVLFLVFDPLSTSISNRTVLAVSAGSGSNQSAAFGVDKDWAGSASDMVAFTTGRNSSEGWTLQLNGAAAVPAGKVVLEYHLTPTTMTTFINGVQDGSFNVVPAQVPQGTGHITLGGQASATTTVSQATVNFYEGFLTNSIGNAATFRAELAARHGITLP